MYLNDRRQNLDTTHKLLKQQGIESGFYVGGMKPDALRESSNKASYLGNVFNGTEGMDIPKLNTILLGSPKSDIVQSVGRILRQTKETRKFHPFDL